MKTFEGENHYQILQVPVNAGAADIRRAYREALAIYEEESIATYSLFSAEQRAVLLQAIEKAFDTLIDEDKRAAYNQMLIDSGQMEAAVFSQQDQRKLAAHSDTRVTSKEKSLSQWVEKKADAPEIHGLIDAIRSKEMISGRDLKQLREALGIEYSEIYAITRINSTILNMIESDRFDDLPAEIYLKQFLKAYAEILRIDAPHVVQGYLRSMAQAKPDR
jgi:curved DNA-binding protein CbpA